MWVHPDLVNDEQWSLKPIKGKGKSCNVISLSSEGKTVLAASLTDSEKEASPTTQQASTRSRKQYLKQHQQISEDTQQASTSGNPAPTPPVSKEKQKEVRFDKALKRNSFPGLNTPFNYDIMTQLANIPARITLHELLRLSKDVREALRKALAEADSFLIQLPPSPEEEEAEPKCPHCNFVLQNIPHITFSPEDMLLKDNKHNRPLYYTGYISSSYIERIQVDPGSALSIIPRRLLHFLGIPLHRLSNTTTTI